MSACRTALAAVLLGVSGLFATAPGAAGRQEGPRGDGVSLSVQNEATDLVRVYEGAGGTGWSFESLPDDYVAGMQRGIVAFEIPIERLEGKAKLSQNRDAVDQGQTREALAATDDPLARAVAAMMAGGSPR